MIYKCIINALPFSLPAHLCLTSARLKELRFEAVSGLARWLTRRTEHGSGGLPAFASSVDSSESCRESSACKKQASEPAV